MKTRIKQNNEAPKNRMAALVAGAAMLAGPLAVAIADSQGGISTRETVLAYDTDSYNRSFRGRENGTVVVRGDGDTDLDLYVYGPSGTIVAMDEDDTDQCSVSFYVPRSGAYTIRVVNRGDMYNSYIIATN